MSFGIFDRHDPMIKAISNAANQPTLLFAAASNGGANFGRSFPARHSSVFGIHSTDWLGNPSNFNPTASKKDFNFSLLGEDVSSHWPAGMQGHDTQTKLRSGTSTATQIAAGFAASVLAFVRQQDLLIAEESERLAPYLKDHYYMKEVLKSISQERGGYDYIRPHLLFDSGNSNATREVVYCRIKDAIGKMHHQ
jgi:hypothetical protein